LNCSDVEATFSPRQRLPEAVRMAVARARLLEFSPEELPDQRAAKPTNPLTPARLSTSTMCFLAVRSHKTPKEATETAMGRASASARELKSRLSHYPDPVLSCGVAISVQRSAVNQAHENRAKRQRFQFPG
jgi:hypothetical protein